MKSFLAVILSSFVLLGSVNAFSARPMTKVSGATPSVSLKMVFGNKKSAATKAEEKAKAEKYWQGEWVCKDCGYIYNRVCLCCSFLHRRSAHNLTPNFDAILRRNVLDSTLRNKDQAFVALSARGLVVVMPKRLVTVSERHWMEVMLPFCSLALVESLPRLFLAFGLPIICKARIQRK